MTLQEAKQEADNKSEQTGKIYAVLSEIDAWDGTTSYYVDEYQNGMNYCNIIMIEYTTTPVEVDRDDAREYWNHN